MTAPIRVADYIARQISLCGRSQQEIAQMMGYQKPNVITMIKQGHTKLPINKVGPMARALNVDPGYLLRLTLQEYLPDTWEAIEPMIGRSLVTENELEIVKALRKLTGNTDPKLRSGSQRNALEHFTRLLRSSG